MNLVTTFFEFLLYFLFILVIYYSFKMNGKYPTLIFFLPLFIQAFIIEELAVAIFYGFYYPNYNIYLLHVPLGIVLGWCSVVYISFYLAKKLLTSEYVGSKTSLLKLSITSALIGLGIDLFLEPISSVWNFWIWNNPDIYFNASIENFISWFMIIFLFISVYTFLTKKVEGYKKKILLMFASVIPQVIILITIIMIWKFTINL